ncbi:PAS domain-containing sensor histidine kinase [Flavobacterium silvisoli]|uniref:histidine kinase n=1 Tax=Flavobacterium silvisoli TaxID=2529433 RepID=A0A4Q9Z1U5_9FLAO|nr:PAS domain-containing sensor histidine kinase [Flavobacterium silvisoli]TBX70042.1 PAS domain-containing sensor histidine kinase [Flavobacterium silvisoli]
MNEKYNHLCDTYNTELFFELSADLLFIAGFDGYFKKVNPAACQLLEYSAEELLDKPINYFIHEDDRDITTQNRNNIKAGIPLLNFENRYVTKSGDIIWLSWTSMPLDDLELVYAIAKNITHIKKMEEERNTLLLNLQKINKDLKKLTYTASHDMRSPVNNLLTVYSLLDTSKIDDEETFEYIEMSKKATEGLKQTLDNYVDNISHNESLLVKSEPLSFEKSLQSVSDSIKSLIKSTRTTLVYDFSEADTIQFNKSYLDSIFLNLITNAIKYANPEVMPIVTISSKKKHDITQLIVTDNGQGFDIKKVKNKIFGLNQKFHNNPDSKGIGLYLVYHHVMDMGGSIDVQSQIGVGTTFTINFKN